MAGHDEELEPQRLLTLLTRQRDLYTKLRELSDKQRMLISGDRPEMLLNILRDRQSLVNSLAALNEQLAPYRRGWDAMYASLPDQQREQASVLLGEINTLLRVILKTDKEDSVLLSARKQAVAQEMSGLTGGQTVNAAYAGPKDTSSTSSAELTG